MKKRIIILLLSICLFCSGCIEVTYSSKGRISFFPEKEPLQPMPEIVGYDYPYQLKTIQELKRIEPIEVKEEPLRLIFTKFTN